MKVALKIKRDSWNSHPSDYLEMEIWDDGVTISIKGEPERTIEVSKEEFRQFCVLLRKSPEVEK